MNLFGKTHKSSSDFVQYFPRDTVRAELETEFRVAYDDKFLYIFAKMEDISEMQFILRRFEREIFLVGQQIISLSLLIHLRMRLMDIILDLSPYNIQREALTFKWR